MPTIDVDRSTFDSIDLAARITGMTHAQVVARLVRQAQTAPTDPVAAPELTGQTIDIYVDYEGHRTAASFDQVTNRVDIIHGPLAEQTFKSPSSAARAVIAHYKPEVNPQRNGWTFWMIDDGSGRYLQSVRGR